MTYLKALRILRYVCGAIQAVPVNSLSLRCSILKTVNIISKITLKDFCNCRVSMLLLVEWELQRQHGTHKRAKPVDQTIFRGKIA